MTDLTNGNQDGAPSAAHENLTDAELDAVAGGFIIGAVTSVGKFVKDVAVGAFEGGMDGVRAGFNGPAKR
ncbi:hypothetical protein W911_11685 [Hyphomicrobium nitrativorans NL23]|uniref:Bacteriocin n=1 Tax=Hyphomicrobium nitrativorans NL23 TaxID=1029756 RepID=V5SI99_9HYPH|nr:hypothetical protein [Hyphomicrobium nitrativorans]AHB50227.1 hypothetical protein W911_11685 [Hyphomicrobium nitrativorans NL23]